MHLYLIPFHHDSVLSGTVCREEQGTPRTPWPWGVWNSQPFVSEDFDDLSWDAHEVMSSSWESFLQLLVTGQAIHW